jgi:hypothetical protein
MEKLYDQYGEPVLKPVNRLDSQKLPPGAPKYGILPLWLEKQVRHLHFPSPESPLISDFGEAFSPTHELKYDSHKPLPVRPPEARFEPDEPLTFPSDIWTLTCTIWDIICQRPLFEGFPSNQDDMTWQQIDALGPLPTDWRENWAAQRDRSTEHGEPIQQSRSPYQSWENRFEANVQQPRIKEGMPTFQPSKRDSLSSISRSVLSFWLENRPSVRQILESEWMVK